MFRLFTKKVNKVNALKKDTLIVKGNGKETVTKPANAESLLASYIDLHVKEPFRFTYHCEPAKDEHNIDVNLHVITDCLTKIRYTFVRAF